MAVNYFGSLYAVKLVVPHMLERRAGQIALISSIAGFLGVFGYTGYSPTKFALMGLAEALRSELKRYNVKVSVVCPPDTDTPQLAYEDQFKPYETKLISGTVKPVSADFVATHIWDGLARDKAVIIHSFKSKLIFFLNRKFKFIVTASINAKLKKAQKACDSQA